MRYGDIVIPKPSTGIASWMERDLDRERSLEAERKKVFGACGGVCGEAPCIEWNRQEKERLEREAKRAEFLRGLEEKSGGHLSV